MMLIKLFHPVEITSAVQPVVMPTSCPTAGQSCHVSGWGNTDLGGEGERNRGKARPIQTLLYQFILDLLYQTLSIHMLPIDIQTFTRANSIPYKLYPGRVRVTVRRILHPVNGPRIHKLRPQKLDSHKAHNQCQPLWKSSKEQLYLKGHVPVLCFPTVYMPVHLQCLDVPIIDEATCMEAYPHMISPRMVCAGFMEGGKDACNVCHPSYSLIRIPCKDIWCFISFCPPVSHSPQVLLWLVSATYMYL